MRRDAVAAIEALDRRNFRAKMSNGRSTLRKTMLDILCDPEQMEQIRKDEAEYPWKSYQAVIEAHQALSYRYGG